MFPNQARIIECVERGRHEANINERVRIVHQINSLLPTSYKIHIPSLITNNYIDMVLDRIEEQILTDFSEPRIYSAMDSNLDEGHFAHTTSEHNPSKREIRCNCGNSIEYDEIQLNCSYPEYKILICRECNAEHRIVADGLVNNIVGAT